jgi:zinc protease
MPTELCTAPRIERHSAQDTTCLTLTDTSFAMVRFVVATRLGAMLDAPQRPGATQMMFELLLRGTQRRSRHAFHQAVEVLGAQVDTSVGHEMALCRGMTLRRHLDAVWSLMTEALLHPAFELRELQRLQAETLEELAMERDDDDAVADYFLRRTLFAGHRLSRSPGGDGSDVQALQLGDIHRAYAAFRSQPLIVAFAGDIAAPVAHQYAEALGAALRLPAAKRLSAGDVPAVPPLRSRRLVVVDKPNRTQVQLRVAAFGPLGEAPDMEAFWLGIMAFGGTFTSPYTREVRDIRGWSYVAHADYRRRARYAAPLVLRCAPALGDAVPCLQLSLKMFGELAAAQLSDEAIHKTRQYVLNRYPFEVATVFDMLGAALGQEAANLPQDHLLQLPARLEALTPAAITQSLAAHLTASACIGLVVGPKEILVPQLQQQFADAEVQVVDYREGLLGSS